MRRTVQHQLWESSNVSSLFVQNYVNIDMCWIFENPIISVIISYLLVSNLTVWQG